MKFIDTSFILKFDQITVKGFFGPGKNSREGEEGFKGQPGGDHEGRGRWHLPKIFAWVHKIRTGQ